MKLHTHTHLEMLRWGKLKLIIIQVKYNAVYTEGGGKVIIIIICFHIWPYAFQISSKKVTAIEIVLWRPLMIQYQNVNYFFLPSEP